MGNFRKKFLIHYLTPALFLHKLQTFFLIGIKKLCALLIALFFFNRN